MPESIGHPENLEAELLGQLLFNYLAKEQKFADEIPHELAQLTEPNKEHAPTLQSMAEKSRYVVEVLATYLDTPGKLLMIVRGLFDIAQGTVLNPQGFPVSDQIAVLAQASDVDINVLIAVCDFLSDGVSGHTGMNDHWAAFTCNILSSFMQNSST